MAGNIDQADDAVIRREFEGSNAGMKGWNGRRDLIERKLMWFENGLNVSGPESSGD
jgi:hypothetical protein